MSPHLCTEPECPFEGQPTGRSCRCHKTDEQVLRERVTVLEAALEAIANHWACDYDHKHANTEAYRGSYGIGIVDGHRAAATIARAALAKSQV